jgi:chromate reductase, NAD(P)H dehydrogenase (quinone)
MKKIPAFTGSNSSSSVNRKIIELAIPKFQSLEATLIDLRDFPLPMFSTDIEEETGIPSEAKRLRKLFDQHDGFLISSPEHNGMMPAFFKNTMDWLSRLEGRIFQEKPVMLMSASPGPRGGATNLANMQRVIPHWGASAVFADFSMGGFHQNFDMENGSFIHADDHNRLTAAIQSFEDHLAD